MKSSKLFRRSFLGLLLALGLAALPQVALAATGVSEERLSLPEGPGSLEGLGENISVNHNMGQMSYSVPIVLPSGYPGLTPGLALEYSSGSGNSVVGMGWSLAMPSIERLTVRGLPRYSVEDEFSVDGGEELVYVGGTAPRIYRARFESGFVRYSWYEAGTGGDGYWTAEYPDGRISYYGADHTGATVVDSRVSGTRGTFRFHLVETSDRYGHLVQYSYERYGNFTLLNHIGWVFVGGEAQYEVSFSYADRYDKVSDCRAGFEELLTKRLQQVYVRAHGTLIRRYALTHEDYATSGGFSRLVGVEEFGVDGGRSPIYMEFQYSRALGVACSSGCEKPYLVSMGSLGVDLAQGKTTLIDMNGDSLPDVLDTSEAGKPHRFFFNQISADGTHKFSSSVQSGVGGQGSHAMGSPYVHVLDLDGNGFTDLMNAQTGMVLVNLGEGDWTESKSLWEGNGGLPDLGAEGSLASVKFMDYDGDKRIDLLFSKGDNQDNSTMVFRNAGSAGFVVDEDASPVGIGFEAKAMELNDLNGDSLLDVVVVTKDSLRYRLNLGWGQWSDWHVIEGFSFTDQEAEQAELDDLNGDGLADLCLVAGNELRYWINRNGESFDPEVRVTSDEVNGSIPERLPTTTVLHADMNGNGSTDIVWVQASGTVTYLELFPVRPNLLTKITNGLGRVTDVTYAASVLERARDKSLAAWAHPLPYPMTVVKQTDEWDELSEVHTVTEFAYHDGFYDGVEKRFRGYAKVEGSLAGDELQEAGYTFEQFDVGVGDPYMAGKVLSQEQRSAGKTIQITTTEYEDCPVAEVPATGLLFAVRNVCEVKEVVEHRERLTQPQDWATTATEWEHDGYGNVLLESDLGVTAMGGKACPACEGDGYTGTPCGPKCLGDEAYKRTEFAGPADNDNRWILRKQVREQKFGVANAQGEPANELYSETVFYYDGTEFQGLPEGKVTHGTPTRITTRKDGTGAVVTQSRNRVDAHGNVVEAIDPLGEVDGTTHRRLYTMDDEGLKLVEVEILNEDAQGAYSLRQEVKYDALWGKPIEATVWRKVVDGTAVDPANSSYYTYDEFGRLTAIVRPGDSLAKPTEEFEYDLANPVSAVATRKRSVSGGALDLESVKCVDGRGRDTQIRVKVAEGNWQVKGFSIFNAHGSERRTNYPYLATTGDCANEVPQGTLKQQYRYDAMGRKLELFLPQVGDETADAVVRTVLGPMDRLEYDLNDTEAGGPHFDTPTRVVRNGLDQIIRVERLDKPAGTPLVHQIRYDEIGHIAAITDPIGATLVQQHDLLGRVVKSVHPDAGTTLYEFDDAGNLVRTEDGRGKVVRSQFDGLNRIVARWDEEDPTGSRISWIYDRPVTCPAEQCTNTAARTAEISFTVAGQPAGERLGYDSRGQQIWRQLLLQGHAFTSTTTHDNAGRITSVTHPSGLVINTQLDGADRAMKVPGYVDQFQYQPDGVVGTILAANGVQTIRTFDERKRLESITVTAPDDSLVIAHSLTLDPAGNILEVADDRGEEDVPQGGGRFTYDSLYRLLEAKLDPSRPAHAETLSYTYDQGDRVLSSTSDLGGDSVAHVGTLSYGVGAGPHAVTKAGDLDFTYDGAGLASSRGTVDYKWDAFGRMVAASEGSNTLARFSYGEANDRLVKDEDGHQTLYLAADFEVRDGTAVTYVEIGQDRLARVEEPAFAATALSDLAPASGTDLALVSAPDGIITAADAWLAAAAKAGSLGFTDEAPLDSPTVLLNASVNRMLGGLDSKVTWLHADHRGDLVAETDGSGKVTSRTEFYPYGMERSAQGKGDPHGFTGKETDESTGLTYFGARYLDPWTGRWTAPDPSFLVASQITETNLAEMTGAYLYGGDNPLTMVDKTGHNFNPAHGIYYFKSSAMKKTVAKLMQGDLRPSLGFMTAFGLRPDAPISKKLAWKMVKTANSIMKNDHVTVDAFRPGGSTASIKEFSNSILEIQQSPIYSKVAYEQGRNRDLAKFGIQSAVLGGALDTKINRDIMVGEGSFQGPVKQNEKFVGTSNVPVATEWVHLLSNIGGQLPRQSLEPQKKPGLWSRIKAKIGGGG